MKRFIVYLLVLTMLSCLIGCSCKHEWVEIDRTPPGCASEGVVLFACTNCDETTKETVPATGNHTWVEATCDTPRNCAECGAQEGEAIGHTWVEATCTTAKVCQVCGTIDGEKLGHTMLQGLCDRCGLYITIYGTMSPRDAEIFYIIKGVVEDFKNPASVRVVEVHHYDAEDGICYATISAQNSFGATTKKCYWISKSGNILESSTYSYKEDPQCNESDINAALQKFYKAEGWK